MAREARKDDTRRIVSAYWFELVTLKEERMFLLVFEGDYTAAVATYSSAHSIITSRTSHYHHIADVLLRGQKNKLRVMMIGLNDWSEAG